MGPGLRRDDEGPKTRRPARGDNRAGQSYISAGVDGRSRNIQPRWGGITAPTWISRGRRPDVQKRRRIFLTFRAAIFRGEKLLFGRLFRRHGGGGRAQIPCKGKGLRLRNRYGRRLVRHRGDRR